jgi:hypothetical protein
MAVREVPVDNSASEYTNTGNSNDTTNAPGGARSRRNSHNSGA